jgi:hypothetical protein
VALSRDLSALPTPATLTGDGRSPDVEPRFVQALVERWRDEDPGPKPRAVESSRFRHSDAGKCARAVAYAALGVPDSNPMDISGWWNTGLGTVIHEMWQDAIKARYPDVELEPKVSLGQGSGHIDAVLVHEGRKVAIELKSTGGYSHKMSVGAMSGPAQGPKFEHVVQASLNGLAVDADEVVIAYIAKEAISVGIARRKGFSELTRIVAEWTFDREEYVPIAEAEMRRIDGILALLDEGTLPARKIPGEELPPGAVITDPSSGQWQVLDAEGLILNAGTYWACDGYCRWQDRCRETAAGRQPISEVAVALGIKAAA